MSLLNGFCYIWRLLCGDPAVTENTQHIAHKVSPAPRQRFALCLSSRIRHRKHPFPWGTFVSFVCGWTGAQTRVLPRRVTGKFRQFKQRCNPRRELSTGLEAGKRAGKKCRRKGTVLLHPQGPRPGHPRVLRTRCCHQQQQHEIYSAVCIPSL